VIVSSHAEFEYARGALRLGVTEYLLKPVRPEELAPASGASAFGPTTPEDDAVLGPVLEYFRRNFNADASVADAAAIAGLSPNYLSALIPSEDGRDYQRVPRAAPRGGGGQADPRGAFRRGGGPGGRLLRHAALRQEIQGDNGNSSPPTPAKRRSVPRPS
jgi:CheY-like chemotaxis protein